MKAISGRITATLGAVLVTCLPLAVSAQQVPAGYPGDYAKIIEAAKQEGKVVVYGATDAAAANPLIKDFEAMYPGVKVEYNDMNTTELYNRLISEKAAGAGSADVTWSSAMDLQVKLVTPAASSRCTRSMASARDIAPGYSPARSRPG